MAPELNRTSIAETFIKSHFGHISKKRKSRHNDPGPIPNLRKHLEVDISSTCQCNSKN
jgi:hypothetical protein